MAISKHSASAARRRGRRLRLAVLVSLLVLITALGILHQFPLGFRPPGVDALCPFGGLEALYTLITTGGLMDRIAASSFVLLLITLVVALLFRRSFCGTICPLGTLQELSHRLGRRLFRRRFTVPRLIDRPARYLKYLVLVAVVALSAAFGELIVRPYDPWVAYQHLVSVELLTGFLIGFIVLAVSLVASLFYDRFFCRYLCPMGALLGLISKIGWFRVRRDAKLCTSCGACDRACPVNLSVSTVDEVRSAECLSCTQCVLACPVKGALEISGPARSKRRTLKPRTVIAATFGLFALVILGSVAIGQFPVSVPSITETVAETGHFDPADVKGSDTFAAVAAASGLERQLFLERFSVSPEEFDRPIKESAHRATKGFEVQDVRDFISAQLAQTEGAVAE